MDCKTKNFQLHAPKFWQYRNFLSIALLPLAVIYLFITKLRRFYYLKIRHPTRFNCPVIVVGNVTVGGTGKTPLVIWLAEYLKQQGYKPGVVSRGYGGKTKTPVEVTYNSDPQIVGDEALVIVHRTNCPMVVGVNRVKAVRKLLTENVCNLVISDDGLQHYALGRDIEITVLDQIHGFGNGFCLPAGPLRELPSFLQHIDFKRNIFNMVYNGQGYTTQVLPGKLTNINQPNVVKDPNDFVGRKVHAVAGIGNPEKFFTALEKLGLTIIRHPFPDHYVFQAQDFTFTSEPVIMTEKDAVKCEKFATENFWYLPITLQITPDFGAVLVQQLRILDHSKL